MIAVVLSLLLAAVAGVNGLQQAVPDAYALQRAGTARPSVLLWADGQPLASFNPWQQPVTLDQVPPHLLQALLATEDARFYEHRGIDPRRTVAALLNSARGRREGGSTLTQQLARTLFPEQVGRERSLTRKLKEIITALRLERRFSKRQILEAYLNHARFLHNVVGIEMAARTYFGTSAKDLDLLQSATLVGMLKGPAYYNPVLNPGRSTERRNLVLRRMVRHGMLAPHTYAQLAVQPLQVSFSPPPDTAAEAPHFVVQVRRWLADWAAERHLDTYTDGLVVHTTLDRTLQQAALRAVQRQADALQAVADVEWAQADLPQLGTSTEPYVAARARATPFAHLWQSRPDLLQAFTRESAQHRRAAAGDSEGGTALRRLLADDAWLARLKQRKTRLEAGLLAVDPGTGEVKAWVGSRDFELDRFDHVSQAERQPGSTFKAFVYGSALESGIGPWRTYLDDPFELRLGNGSIWRPRDLRPPSGLPMTLRNGLVYSRNTITVRVAQDVGIERVATLARAMGVERSRLDPVPALALGTSPVTLAEMVNAYATIAHRGERVQPVLVRRITDADGQLLATPVGATRQALSDDSATELIDMLRDVVTRGTGTLVRRQFGIEADVAGKTGTTQNHADGWFILMHPQLVAGAWVGFNDARVTMRSSHWGQGGHNAARLVGDFFRSALDGGSIDPGARFPSPRRPPPAQPRPPDDDARQGEGDAAPDETPPADSEGGDGTPAPMLAAGQAGAPAPASTLTLTPTRPSPGEPAQASAGIGRAEAAPEPSAPMSAAELERVVELLNHSPGSRTRTPFGSSP